MTHAHAKRRGVTPRPSEAHLRMLARLVKRAEVAAKTPTDAKKALVLTQEAERVARQAVLPVGHQSDEASPVVRLIRMAKGWHLSKAREAEAQSLSELAAWAREIVDAALLGLGKPERKDIDG